MKLKTYQKPPFSRKLFKLINKIHKTNSTCELPNAVTGAFPCRAVFWGPWRRVRKTHKRVFDLILTNESTGVSLEDCMWNYFISSFTIHAFCPATLTFWGLVIKSDLPVLWKFPTPVTAQPLRCRVCHLVHLERDNISHLDRVNGQLYTNMLLCWNLSSFNLTAAI